MQQTKNVYSKEVLCLCNRISICLFLYFYAVYNIFLLLTNQKFQVDSINHIFANLMELEGISKLIVTDTTLILLLLIVTDTTLLLLL